MTVNNKTEAAFNAYLEIQVELQDAKIIAKEEIRNIQREGESDANSAKNTAYNAAQLAGNDPIRAAVAASKAAFAPYREEIKQIEASVVALQNRSDQTWKAYEVARGIGA